MGPALEQYAESMMHASSITTAVLYSATVSSLMMWNNSLNWDQYRIEIDAGRPMVLLVDTNSDGVTDHFVTAVGYDVVGSKPMYACLNTWDGGVHWYEFQEIGSGISWGIFGGVTFEISGVEVVLTKQVYFSLVAREG